MSASPWKRGKCRDSPKGDRKGGARTPGSWSPFLIKMSNEKRKRQGVCGAVLPQQRNLSQTERKADYRAASAAGNQVPTRACPMLPVTMRETYTPRAPGKGKRRKDGEHHQTDPGKNPAETQRLRVGNKGGPQRNQDEAAEFKSSLKQERAQLTKQKHHSRFGRQA